MKKIFLMLAAYCCTMALSAATYTSHLKVTVNGETNEQEQLMVDITRNANGLYDLSLKNFVLVSGEVKLPVGNINVNGLEGTEEYGYTTVRFDGDINIVPGDDPTVSPSDWVGPMLGPVPSVLTSRFTGTAMSADIDIELAILGQTIKVNLFGIAPVIKGDVNEDGEVNIGDVNAVIDIILK